MPKEETKDWNAEGNRFAKKLDDKMFRTWMFMMNRHKEIVGNMAEEGVGILAGTDASTANPFTFPGFSLHDELAMLVECGLSNGKALQTATINSAKYLKATDSLGAIKIGNMADLVLLNKNPLNDIKNTTSIETVISNGEIFNRSTLDSLLQFVKKHFNK